MPKSSLFESEQGQEPIVQRFYFHAKDPDEFADLVSPVASGITAQATAPEFASQVDVARLPRLGLFSVRLSNLRVISTDNRDYVSLTVPLDAPIRISDRSGAHDYARGESHLMLPRDEFDLSKLGSATVLVANFDEKLLRSFGQCLEPEEGFDPERLARRISFATPEGSSLWRHLALIWNQIDRDGTLARSSLALREIELSLIALLVLASDVDSQNGSGSGKARLSPAHQRRAEEYLEAHVTAPVSMAELARAAGVSARTVLRAFKHHHGVSPMAFLKQRRLEAAQRSLIAADPQRATVSEVATRYGFFNFGRFARDYQKAFHEKPSDTLKR